ncbi:hypothetical protein BH11MYX3_BH11MYX3_02680 [soil metagenome]
MRGFALILLAAAACGRRSERAPDAANNDDASLTDASALGDGPDSPDATVDATLPDAAINDAFPAIVDLRIDCHNDCTLIANPAAINVPAGTGFEVNWINTGDTECDVAKVDQFNQVPIIIGLEPGTSYHDPVHTWCGAIFTGTFRFRINICTLPSYIPVNCGA